MARNRPWIPGFNHAVYTSLSSYVCALIFSADDPSWFKKLLVNFKYYPILKVFFLLHYLNKLVLTFIENHKCKLISEKPAIGPKEKNKALT